jgi:hypothetical protein
MDATGPRWPMFRDVLRRQRLMDDMMKRCGVDVLEVIRSDKGRSFAEARARCRFCLSARTCREWLLSPRSEFAMPPDFCPNAHLFRLHLRSGQAAGFPQRNPLENAH